MCIIISHLWFHLNCIILFIEAIKSSLFPEKIIRYSQTHCNLAYYPSIYSYKHDIMHGESQNYTLKPSELERAKIISLTVY